MSNELTTEKSPNAVSWLSRLINSMKSLTSPPSLKHFTAAHVVESERLSPEVAIKGRLTVQADPVSAPAAAPAPDPAAVAQLREKFASRAPFTSAQATSAMTTLSIGQIGTRLGFALPSAFLESLGFQPTRHRGAVLFHEEQFPAICEAIVGHVYAVLEAQAA